MVRMRNILPIGRLFRRFGLGRLFRFDGFRRLFGQGPIFVDREFIVRSTAGTRVARLSRRTQMVVVGVAAVAMVSVGVSSMGIAFLGTTLALRDHEIDRREKAYQALSTDLALEQRRFRQTADALERNHEQLSGVLAQNQTLKKHLDGLSKNIARAETSRRSAKARSRSLNRQIAALQKQISEIGTQNQELEGNLNQTSEELQSALHERLKSYSKRAQLLGRIETLERTLADVRTSQSLLTARVAEQAKTEIEKVREVVALAGLKYDSLLKSLRKAGGKGGPFVPDQTGSAGNKELAMAYARIEQWEDSRQLLMSLPLMAPVDHYRLSSRYGRRKDPLNGKWAWHGGIDLSAPPRRPVLSPAPGKVVFAGRKGRFGKMVEIDHGRGIKTRYGHLRKIHVKRGQRISTRDKIGQVGSTGRSTGPHLHYEILVNGKTVDPLKFIEAGKHVFKESG